MALKMPLIGLRIDIRAMAEIVDTLMICYRHCDRVLDFPPVLERIRVNIHPTLWQRKITYFQAINALGPTWNEELGRSELRKLGDLSDNDDIQTFQLYLDLFRSEMSFSDKNRIIDHIIANSDKVGDWLHYKGAKAVLYHSIGDQGRAESEAREAVGRIDLGRDRQGLGCYGVHRFAQTLGLLGMINKDRPLLEHSTRILDDLLDDEDWSEQGRANLLGEIAENYRHLANWQRALTYYERAIEIYPRAIHKVFMCQCLVAVKMYSRADHLFRQIDVVELSLEEYIDYVFVLAFISLTIKSHDSVMRLVKLLKDLHIANPYFREYRDSLLLNCHEYISRGSSRTLSKRIVNLLYKVANSPTSYLILQPNIMGMGVDIGKIIKDVAQGSEDNGIERKDHTSRTSRS